MVFFGPTYGYVFSTAEVSNQDGDIVLTHHCHLKSKSNILDSSGKVDLPFLINACNEALVLCPDLKQFSEVCILFGKINGETLVINDMFFRKVIAEDNSVDYRRPNSNDVFQKDPMVFNIKQLEQWPNKKI